MRGILFACVAALTACAPSDGSTDGGPLRIVATTGQVADAARVVGGDDVVVDALMGPGVDPHLYKASAGDLEKLRKADVVFYNGKGLEGKMADVLAKLARKKRVRAVSESIPDRDLLRPKELEGHYDPHIWFDVKLWIKAVNVIMSELAEAAPAQADTFRANAARFKRELAALDAQIRTGLNEIPKERRVLITSHDAFRYYGRAYDMEVRGLQGISTVSQAGVKDVQDLAQLIVARRIKAIFVETSVAPKAIRAVQEAAKRKGWNVKIGGELYSDAMGDHAPVNTYLGMMRANLKTLVEALK